MKMVYLVVVTMEGVGNDSNGGDEGRCDRAGDGGDSDTGGHEALMFLP